MRLLLQFGAKQSVVSRKGTKNSALHAAAQAGHGGIASQLLSHGADVNCKGEDEMTPLFAAVAKNDGNSCVRILLQYGADVNAEDTEHRTPLLVATQNGMLSNARALLEHGADIDHKAEDGWTSLASCIFWNMHDSILFLLEHGASYTLATDEGDTVLHIAARYGDVDTLDILGDAGLEGLDPEALNEAGRSALEIADGRTEEEPLWYKAFRDMLERVKAGITKREKFCDVFAEKNRREKGDEEFVGRIVELSDDDSEEVVFEDALDMIT